MTDIDVIVPHHYEGLLEGVLASVRREVPDIGRIIVMDSVGGRHDGIRDTEFVRCNPSTGEKLWRASRLVTTPWTIILADDTILLDGFWDAVSKCTGDELDYLFGLPPIGRIGAVLPRGYFCFRDGRLGELLSSSAWAPHLGAWRIAGCIVVRTDVLSSCRGLRSSPMREDAVLLNHALRNGYAVTQTDEYVVVHSPHVPYEDTCVRTMQRGAYHDPWPSIPVVLWRIKSLATAAVRGVPSALPLAARTASGWSMGLVGRRAT